MKAKFSFSLLSVLFISSLLIMSCKKDKDEKPSLIGFWTGKYSGNATAYPTSQYAVMFKADGTARVFNRTDTTTGDRANATYTVAGSTITCTYTYLPPGSGTFTFKGDVNTQFSFIEGTWGSGSSPTAGGGRFYFVKN